MNLFGKKLRYSSLRFCKHAVELPLLFDMPVITIAISHIAESRHFPTMLLRDGGRALGLLHSHGLNRPLLPVEIEFTTYTTDEENRIAWGNVSWRDVNAEEHYVLQMGVSDPDHSIYDALLKAMERAAISQHQYYHVEFRNDYLNHRNTHEKNPNYTKQGEERRAMLTAVDAGQAELPYLAFDEIAFSDVVTTDAPPWSWNWDKGNSGMYHDPKVAHYRKVSNWPPLPDT